tara:strand:+ start:167 stop:667 length:501 start_codon:yes stop_codon:yes gene_type:complete
MSQEFIIKSQQLEDKINQLLPSQGGFQAGVDLSASTQIIPIVDLTETAEGSQVRADLQTAFAFGNITHNSFNNSTVDLVNTPGFYRVFGTYNTTGATAAIFKITDGASTKNLIQFQGYDSVNGFYDFVVFLRAGDTLQAQSNAVTTSIFVSTRQLADINGNLIDVV